VVLGQSVFASNAGLAFVFFIAFSLMAVLGVRFAAYAFWNRQDTDIESQEQLWEYLVLVGIAAAASLYSWRDRGIEADVDSGDSSRAN